MLMLLGVAFVVRMRLVILVLKTYWGTLGSVLVKSEMFCKGIAVGGMKNMYLVDDINVYLR